MIVDSIEKGIVIDHLTPGMALRVLDALAIDTKGSTVAIILNATSKRCGRKDLIKIENKIDVDLTVLGLLDPTATVNIIENGCIKQKINLELPEKVVNVVMCKNPRCVTSVEVNAPHIFCLVSKEKQEYRCEYCDEIVALKGEFGNRILHL